MDAQSSSECAAHCSLLCCCRLRCAPPRGSPICTFWAAGLIVTTLGNVWAEQRERWGLFELTRLVQFVMCMLSVLIYYDGSNVINRYRCGRQASERAKG